MKQVKVFIVRNEEGGPAYITKHFESLDWVFEESVDGDKILIDVATMDYAKYLSLPDFEGF